MAMRRNPIVSIFALAVAGSLAAQTPLPPLEDGYRRATPPARGMAPGMKVTQLANAGRTFEVVMRRGDEVVAGLTEFAEQNHIRLAHFTAVGAIDSGVLGWSDPAKRAYKTVAINQEVEMVSLSGNISLQNGKPLVHPHCVVAFPDGSTKGGHLLEGHVSLTMQIFVVDAGPAAEAPPAAK